MTLNISEPESQFLVVLLNRFISDTKGEIYRTETPDYKDELKAQNEIAKQLVAKLGSSAAAA